MTITEVAPTKTMPKAVRFLEAARDRLTDPDNWVQRAYAKIRGNGEVDPQSLEADQWCSLGALRWAAGDDFYLGEEWLNRWLDENVPDWSHNVAGFNDSNTTNHSDVLAMFDGAIELARERSE